MKYWIALAFLLTFSLNSFSKEKSGKTFLILFDKLELKEQRTNLEYISLSMPERFQTRSYSGHSEAALLITCPSAVVTACEIGDLKVQINPSTTLRLQEIAFRIIDFEENQSHYQDLITHNNRSSQNERGS